MEKPLSLSSPKLEIKARRAFPSFFTPFSPPLEMSKLHGFQIFSQLNLLPSSNPLPLLCRFKLPDPDQLDLHLQCIPSLNKNICPLKKLELGRKKSGSKLENPKKLGLAKARYLKARGGSKLEKIRPDPSLQIYTVSLEFVYKVI